MHRSFAGCLALFAALAAGALSPRAARAFGHLWEFTEVYSNADGSVQFIEMYSDAINENALSVFFVRSDVSGNEFHFPGNVTGSTVGRHLLIATAGFASLPGAVAPDFVMPDGFLRIEGDTLAFWNEDQGGLPPYTLPPLLWDTFSFGGATPLPTDGLAALARSHGSDLIAPATNSPTNYAGRSGSIVPEPATLPLVALGLALVSLRARRRPAPRAGAARLPRERATG